MEGNKKIIIYDFYLEMLGVYDLELYVTKDEDGKELSGKKKALMDYINTHDKFRETYVQMLTDFISSKNTKKEATEHLLSSEEEAEIRTEEGLVTKEE